MTVLELPSTLCIDLLLELEQLQRMMLVPLTNLQLYRSQLLQGGATGVIHDVFLGQKIRER